MTGGGTAANPYLIGNAADLLLLDGKSGYAELTADIDLNPTNGADSFDGITVGGELYLEGNGYSIKNFYQVLDSSHPNGGLFQGVFAGSVRNLAIENAYILNTNTGAHRAGIIAPELGAAVLENVSVSGAINSGVTTFGTYIGGICAYIGVAAVGGVSFSGCTVAVNIVGGTCVGGFVGGEYSGSGSSFITFDDCTVSCRLYSGATNAGGFVGYSSQNTTSYQGCSVNMYMRKAAGAVSVSGICGGYCDSVTNCACIVDIEGGSFEGIGYSPELVKQTYIKGRAMNVTDFSGFGGQSGAVIEHSYVAVITDCASPYGIGRRTPTVKQSFFDIDLMPRALDSENGATTAQLKSAEWLREQGWAI